MQLGNDEIDTSSWTVVKIHVAKIDHGGNFPNPKVVQRDKAHTF